MKNARWLIAGAWVVHLTAWFLPVAKEGVTFPQGLPGWQAFRVASCAVWPYEGTGVDGWYNVVLCTLSAVTALLFVLGSVWVALLGSRPVRRLSAWIAASFFVLNAHWVVRFGSDRLDLRIGYFLWWFSFALLAVGLFSLSRRAAV
jgi:hypothetical protein